MIVKKIIPSQIYTQNLACLQMILPIFVSKEKIENWCLKKAVQDLKNVIPNTIFLTTPPVLNSRSIISNHVKENVTYILEGSSYMVFKVHAYYTMCAWSVHNHSCDQYTCQLVIGTCQLNNGIHLTLCIGDTQLGGPPSLALSHL